MKKYLDPKSALILVLLFTSTFAISGCGTGPGAENTAAKAGLDNQGRRMPDFGQPKEEASFRGLVTKIVGNEVTFLKIERPTRDASGEGEADVKDDAEAKSDTPAKVIGGTTTGTGGLRGAGGGAGAGGGGFRGTSGGGTQDADTQAAMLARMKEMGAGEETVTIPVGIQMLMPDTENLDKPSMLEATLADIKVDTMISIWLNQDVTDRNVASFVLVSK